MTELRAETLLFAVDPGAATGFAWVAADEDGVLVPASFGSAEVAGRYEAERQFDLAIASGYPLHVVVEQYVITANTATKTRQYDALYINGYIDGVCAKLGIHFEEHPKSYVAKFSTDSKLKGMGWFEPTPDGHANDAARHLLSAAVNLGEAGKLIRQKVAGL